MKKTISFLLALLLLMPSTVVSAITTEQYSEGKVARIYSEICSTDTAVDVDLMCLDLRNDGYQAKFSGIDIVSRDKKVTIDPSKYSIENNEVWDDDLYNHEFKLSFRFSDIDFSEFFTEEDLEIYNYLLSSYELAKKDYVEYLNSDGGFATPEWKEIEQMYKTRLNEFNDFRSDHILLSVRYVGEFGIEKAANVSTYLNVDYQGQYRHHQLLNFADESQGAHIIGSRAQHGKYYVNLYSSEVGYDAISSRAFMNGNDFKAERIESEVIVGSTGWQFDLEGDIVPNLKGETEQEIGKETLILEDNKEQLNKRIREIDGMYHLYTDDTMTLEFEGKLYNLSQIKKRQTAIKGEYDLNQEKLTASNEKLSDIIEEQIKVEVTYLSHNGKDEVVNLYAPSKDFYRAINITDFVTGDIDVPVKPDLPKETTEFHSKVEYTNDGLTIEGRLEGGTSSVKYVYLFVNGNKVELEIKRVDDNKNFTVSVNFEDHIEKYLSKDQLEKGQIIKDKKDSLIELIDELNKYIDSILDSIDALSTSSDLLTLNVNSHVENLSLEELEEELNLTELKIKAATDDLEKINQEYVEYLDSLTTYVFGFIDADGVEVELSYDNLEEMIQGGVVEALPDSSEDNGLDQEVPSEDDKTDEKPTVEPEDEEEEKVVETLPPTGVSSGMGWLVSLLGVLMLSLQIVLRKREVY